jgi:hypothetical protein
MFDVALEFLRGALQTHVATRAGAGAPEVKLTRLVDDAGKWAIPENALALTLVHVEEERTFRAQLPSATLVPVDGASQLVTREPALVVALHVVVAAHFTQYPEALKHLAHALTFFQAHPHFAAERFPALDPRIGRLAVELLPLGYEQLNQLWGFVGAKQLPSAVYKVRLVALQDTAPVGVQPPVTTIVADLLHQPPVVR